MISLLAVMRRTRFCATIALPMLHAPMTLQSSNDVSQPVTAPATSPVTPIPGKPPPPPPPSPTEEQPAMPERPEAPEAPIEPLSVEVDEATETDETELTYAEVGPTDGRAPREVTVTSTTTTTSATYVPGSDMIVQSSERSRPNRPMLVTGLTIFGLSYGASIFAAGISERDADKALFVPIVGPWMDLGDRGCNDADARPCGPNEDFAKAWIVTSGVVQGAGALLALGSLLIPETKTSYDRVPVVTKAKSSPLEVSVSPLALGRGAGLGASGRF